jgi:hypothetical protein
MKSSWKTLINWPFVRLFLSLGLLVSVPPLSIAAESSFTPSVSVSEEITDNFLEQATNKRSEFTTRLTPAMVYRYQSPFWTWDTTYSFEFRNYANSLKNNEYNHTAAVKGSLTLVDNFLFLDLNDTFQRVSLDVSRTVATESSLFLNQTDQNSAVISPYLLWRLRGDSTFKTGYRFTDTRYWDSTGIEKQEHRGFADLSHDVTSRLQLTTGYAFTRLESLPSQFNKHDLSGGFKYEYADKSSISGQLGNSWQYFNSGIDVRSLFWNANIINDFRFAVVTLGTTVSTTEDPLAVSTKETSYFAKLDKTVQRGSFGMAATYSEYVNTETGIRDRRKLGFTSTGRFELQQNLTASLSASAERFSRKTVEEYPYRFSGSSGLSYLLNHDLTLGLTYTYVTNLYQLDSASGAKDINKVVVEIKKVF